MNKKMLEKFKNDLITERERIVHSMKNLNRDSIVDFDGDEIDEIQGGLIASLQNQLSTRDREKVAKIDLALSKINNKTFGACEDCGDDIPEKRLTFNPHSSTCVSCAEEREMNSKKKG
jgi:DnaK suppressor protein